MTGELHLCVNKLVSAPQPGRGCALHPSPPVCVCECGRLLLLLRVSLKRAFLENGPRWQETSQGGTLQVCMSQHVGSLAEEADALIKSYLEPLLIVPSGVSSLTSYHTHPRVGHALDYVCVHQCWEGYF